MHIYIYRAEKGDEEDDGDVEGCGPFDWSGVVKRRKRVEREDVCAEVEGERGREKERLREVLSCGVCSAVGFVCVWTCLVLAAQEGYGVGRKRILLLCSLHL